MGNGAGDSAARVRLTAGVKKTRWVLAPLFLFLALVAWAFASPIGAAPDDDFHLVSIWCSGGENDLCKPGTRADTRFVPEGFKDVVCYAQQTTESAACQIGTLPDESQEWFETRRGNFYGEYPPVYYAAMHVFAGTDITASVLTMRIANALLFTVLATALVALLPAARRRTAIWGWLIALVPLGVFLLSSTNPSGWAVMGVGTAFLAALGWFETSGSRQWILGALYLLGVIMAAGSRGDAAVYVAGATVTAMILTFVRTRPWLIKAALPAAGFLVAVVFALGADQASIATHGFTSGHVDPSAPADDGSAPAAKLGAGLVAYNLLSLPYLWTGVWGTWALGWLDTGLPDVVPWAAAGAFIAVGFKGLGVMNLRKGISLLGVLAVLTVLPVYVLSVGGNQVGENLQPRYLLPLITLFCFLLAVELPGRTLGLTRLQTAVVLLALAGANFVALHINIRRYVTGAEAQGFNLDEGAEWWWSSAPLGPSATWLLGSLLFAAALAALWPRLRPQDVAEGAAARERSAG